MTRKQLYAEALSFDPADLEALAEEILQSLPESTQAQHDAVWIVEARCRDAEFDAGRDTALPAADVIARLRAKSSP